MAYADYIKDLEAVIAKHNIGMPGDLLDDWVFIHSRLETGMPYFEEFPLTETRDKIEILLNEVALRQHSEFQYFVDQVIRYDVLIKELSLPYINMSSPEEMWWRKVSI